MAEQILSQVEVDALLKGLSNGNIKTEPDAPPEITGPVRPYDFANQTRVLRGKMPTLQMMNDKFCRNARVSLFNILRKSIDVGNDGTDMIRYEEFLKHIKVPSSLNVFMAAPLRGHGVLVLDPNLVFSIVDGYFGGDGRYHARIEGREFTNVEQTVIRKVVLTILAELAKVWETVHPVEFKLVRTEMNPQFVNIVTGTDTVVVSKYKMEIETASNYFYMCLPYATVEPIKDKLYGVMRAATDLTDASWAPSLREQVMNVPLGVSGEIGKANISLQDLLNLRVGDVVQLEKKVKEPVEVHVEGVPKFSARTGIMDNNYSLQIIGAIAERG